MEFLTVAFAYKISVSILLISAFVSALELFSIRNMYVDFVFPRTDLKDKRRYWQAMQTTQAVLAVVSAILLYSEAIIPFQIAFVLMTGINLYSYRQRKAGKDGSDQVRLLALLSFSLCFLLDAHYEQIVPMYFMGAQIVLSYGTSGTIKVLSKYWRKGNVLSQVLGTYSYGIPKVAAFLKRNPTIERMASYSAIAGMLAIPITFLIPIQTPLLIALCFMFSFHFMTAILMGLNDFLLTFPLAYCGVLLLHANIFNYAL